MADEESDPESLGARFQALAGDASAAVDLAVRELRGPLRGFLASVLRDSAALDDVEAATWEDVLAKAHEFDARRAHLRAWIYGIGRVAALRELRRMARHRMRSVPTEMAPEQAATQERSVTAPWLRTTVKLQVRQLTDRLPVEDRMLIALRADDQLSWREVAQLMSDSPGDDTTTLEARLRKRYQRLIQKLRLGMDEP